jgi:hypothetical protein
MLEHALEIVATAGVHCRGLDDRAARRDQPVEARAGSLPIARGALPRAHRGDAASAARIALRSICGSSARSRASSTSKRAARKLSASDETIAPTLTNSPRSTRGTTRTIA